MTKSTIPAHVQAALDRMCTPMPLTDAATSADVFLAAEDARCLAILKAFIESCVMPGWQSVPVNPTYEMLTAGYDELCNPLSTAEVWNCYTAMLKAAPSSLAPITFDGPEMMPCERSE